MSEPQVKTRAALMAIVEASYERFARIGEVWTELLDEEQESLATLTELLAARDD